MGMVEPPVEVEPRQATALQLREVLGKIIAPGETAAGYLAILSRHIRRLEMSYVIAQAIEEKIAAFHAASKGNMTKISLFLADLAFTSDESIMISKNR